MYSCITLTDQGIPHGKNEICYSEPSYTTNSKFKSTNKYQIVY